MDKRLKIFQSIILLLIYIFLDIIYKNVIVEIFAYVGFKLVENNIFVDVIAYLIIAIVIYLINFTRNSIFSNIILQLTAVLFLFPSLIMHKNMHTNLQIPIAHLLFFFILYVNLKYFKIRIKSKTLKSNQKLLTLLIIVLVMIIPFIFTFRNNINFKNLFLQDLYETRFNQRELNTPYLAYTYSWLSKIIIPITIIFAIISKSKIKLLLLLILSVYLFLVGAHKSVLFGIIMVLAFYYIPQSKIQISFCLGILSILTISILIYSLFDNYFISGLIVRRVFFIPALLDTYYFEFFKNKPLFWSSSFLSNLIDYPYDMMPPHIIGSEYFNAPKMSANNGIISDGYSNFGWIGIILNITIVSSIFSFFNSLNINIKFIGVFILFFIGVLSSTLTTVLITHGGIILIFVSQFILKDTE